MKKPLFRREVRLPAEQFHKRLQGDMAQLVKGGAVLVDETVSEVHRRAASNAPQVTGHYKRSIDRTELQGVTYTGARALYAGRLEPGGPKNRPSKQAPRGIFDPERERMAQTIETVAMRLLSRIGSGSRSGS